MSGIVAWLLNRTRSDAVLRLGAAGLSALVGLLALLDVTSAGSPQATGAHQALLALGTVLALALPVAAAMLAWQRPSAASLLASALVLALGLSRLLHLHLLLAHLLAPHLVPRPLFCLYPPELAKLLCEAVLAAALRLAAMAAARTGADGTGRTACLLVGWLVLALGLAGALPDAAQSWARAFAPEARRALGAVEGAGEAMVFGAGLLGFAALLRLRRPRRPTRHGSRCDRERARRVAAACAS